MPVPKMVIPTGQKYYVTAKSLLELKAGDWYIGVRCRSCEQFVAIFDDKSRGALPYGEVIQGEGRLRVACSHCSETHEYVPSQLQQRQL
jgi:hypothetical protein